MFSAQHQNTYLFHKIPLCFMDSISFYTSVYQILVIGYFVFSPTEPVICN